MQKLSELDPEEKMIIPKTDFDDLERKLLIIKSELDEVMKDLEFFKQMNKK